MIEEADDFPPDEIRSPEEVATRTLALFCSVAVALGAPREEVLPWLEANGLASAVTPLEARFMNDPSPPKQQTINFGWQSERLVVLLWALKLGELPAPDGQCNTAAFQEVLPPYADIEVKAFLASVQLRSDDELMDMADQLLDLHWHARDAAINNRAPSIPVDIEIIQERHHAINWIIGYDGGVPWDEVTADT